GELPRPIPQFRIGHGRVFGDNGNAVGEDRKGAAEHAVDRRGRTGDSLRNSGHRGRGWMAVSHVLPSLLFLCGDGKPTSRWRRNRRGAAEVRTLATPPRSPDWHSAACQATREARSPRRRSRRTGTRTERQTSVAIHGP